MCIGEEALSLLQIGGHMRYGVVFNHICSDGVVRADVITADGKGFDWETARAIQIDLETANGFEDVEIFELYKEDKND